MGVAVLVHKSTVCVCRPRILFGIIRVGGFKDCVYCTRKSVTSVIQYPANLSNFSNFVSQETIQFPDRS